MSIKLGAASAEHPNKHPFSGVMTYFDVPSDKPVGGSKGRLVLIPSAVGVPALASLKGMAVNMKVALDGHDSQCKIGIIEDAWAGDRLPDGSVPVHVKGYLFAVDFPDEVADLHANADQLGFSYETADTLVEDVHGSIRPTCRVTSLVFTGASILLKNKAAYTKTTLAAQEESNHVEEELKKLLEALQGKVEALETFMASAEVDMAALKASNDALTTENAALKTALDGATEKLTAASADIDTLKAAGETLKASATELVGKADFDAVKEQTMALQTTIDTLKAAEDARADLSRRSFTPHRTSLLAQHGLDENAAYDAVIEGINKMENITTEQRTALVFAARSAHLSAGK